MKIVFLDDEEFLFPLIERYFDILKISNYICTTDENESLLLMNRDYDLLMIDYNMPNIPDINKYVKKITRQINIVIVSGENESYIRDKVNFHYTFLKKPFVIDDLKKIFNSNELRGK